MDEFRDLMRRLQLPVKPKCVRRLGPGAYCMEPEDHDGPHIDQTGRWWL